jgi:hypothetical protein
MPQHMLFHVGFILVASVLLISGFLQFALPEKYVDLANWYIGKTGFGKPISVVKYARWTYRLPGLVLLLGAMFFFYEYAAIVARH